jgi:hypothetical protein
VLAIVGIVENTAYRLGDIVKVGVTTISFSDKIIITAYILRDSRYNNG